MKRIAILGVLMTAALGGPSWANTEDDGPAHTSASALVRSTVGLGEEQKTPPPKTAEVKSKAGIIDSIAPAASSAKNGDPSKEVRLVP